METPLSLRIWSPDDYGQSCQVKINWDDSRPYYASFDPNLFGNPLVYNVECRDGYETYRCILNNFVYSTNPSCPVVELRIPSGYAIVRKCDMTTRISPGIVLRNIIYHLAGIYMKNIIGKYKYRDEKHIGFEKSLIEDFIYPYIAVDGWGQHINMGAGNNSLKIKASTSDEVDSALLAIPLARDFESYANVIVADFKQDDCMPSSEIKDYLSTQRVFLSIVRHDKNELPQEALTDIPQHLTLSYFGLDEDVYQPVDIALNRNLFFDNIRKQIMEFKLPVEATCSLLDEPDSSQLPSVKVTLEPYKQRMVAVLKPVEKTQCFDCDIWLKGPGELTQELFNSLMFRNEPLNGRRVMASGARLKLLINSTPDDLNVLFSLPTDSEYEVERVELHGTRFIIRVEMRLIYQLRRATERLKTEKRKNESVNSNGTSRSGPTAGNSNTHSGADFEPVSGEDVQTALITSFFLLIVIPLIILSLI